MKKRCLGGWFVLVFAAISSFAADRYQDDFNRPDAPGLGPNWSPAFALPEFNLAAQAAAPGKAGADYAAYYTPALADGSPSVIAQVEFQTGFAAENIGLPNLYLGINHQPWKTATVADADFILIQGIGGAKFFADGGWRDAKPLSPPLAPGVWYKMAIQQLGGTFTATITTLDGKILQQNSHLSTTKKSSTGVAFIYHRGPGHAPSAGTPKFRNFSLELSPGPQQDLTTIEPVKPDRGFFLWRAMFGSGDKRAGLDKFGRMILVSDAKPRAGIIISDQATLKDKEFAAAKRLQDYLNRMTGVCLPIGRLSAAKEVKTRILIGPQAAKAAGVEIAQSYPGGERVVVKTVGSDMVIAGNDAGTYQDTRHAVELFLETLGCGWFGPDPKWHVVPKVNGLAVGKMAIDQVPAFEYRGAFMWQGKHPDFDMDMWGMGGVPLTMNHCYYQMFPPAEYYKTHPEYYALVGGKRSGGNDVGGQLCFSNPEVVARTVKLARESFDRDPTKIMFSLSANDCGGFCECAECRKLGVNPAEQSLSFANRVASELRQTHPDKQVVFYAYWFTYAAPTSVKAVPGVSIILINGSCKAHDLTKTSCPGKKLWLENDDKWQKTGAPVAAIYEWYLPSLGGWKNIPWLPGDATLRDLRHYRTTGVKWMYYEGVNGETPEDAVIRWPMIYVAAKGMWNPDLSAREILAPACQQLFGAAAEPMLAFYLELATGIEKSPQHAGNWGLPNPRGVYTPKAMATLAGFLKEASRQAQGGPPEVAQRITDTMAAWAKAEKTIMGFKPVALYEIQAPAGLWYSDKQEVDASYLRELTGINQDRSVFLVGADGRGRALGKDEKLKLDEAKPVTIRTTP